jgi:Fur family transcriptional regulator, peroxide stress response regulator
MSESNVDSNHSKIDRQRRAGALTEKLAQRGYRLTPQRFYIVEALVGDDSHPTAEEIYARVRRVCPTTSLATVYKTLETLKEMGEVLELEFSDGSNRYDGLRPASHPHVVCERCGRIEDVDLDGVLAMQAQAVCRSGYQIDSHRIEFYGTCKRCR